MRCVHANILALPLGLRPLGMLSERWLAHHHGKNFKRWGSHRLLRRNLYINRLGGRRCFGQRSLPREETLTATVPARHAHKKRKGQRFDAATANAVPQGIAPTAAALTH